MRAFAVSCMLHIASAGSVPSRATAVTGPGPIFISRGALLSGTSAAIAATALQTPAAAIPPPEMLARAQAEAEAAARTKDAAVAVLYTPPSVKGESTADQIALAEHLQKIGAKFYGAYWCSFCLKQRTMFGAGGSRRLPYVECAPDGYQNQATTCRSMKELTGYPTWVIGGKSYGGMRTLSELQQISGFDPSVRFAEYVPPPPPPRPPTPPGGFKPPAVEGASTAEQLALARHLKSSGAKFYGAYWCRFCNKQRALFGAEAVLELPYLECASDGYQSAEATCRAKRELEAYPTWEIKGKLFSGLQPLDRLAELSDFTKPDLRIDMGGARSIKSADDGCSLSSGEDNCT